MISIIFALFAVGICYVMGYPLTESVSMGSTVGFWTQVIFLSLGLIIAAAISLLLGLGVGGAAFNETLGNKISILAGFSTGGFLFLFFLVKIIIFSGMVLIGMHLTDLYAQSNFQNTEHGAVAGLLFGIILIKRTFFDNRWFDNGK